MSPRRVSWFVLLSALLFSVAVIAQTRPIPANAKLGRIQHVQQMSVTIDGNAMQLAPGAQIRATNNLIIVPGALPSGGADAAYILDAQGQIFRAWLLTQQELARLQSASGR